MWQLFLLLNLCNFFFEPNINAVRKSNIQIINILFIALFNLKNIKLMYPDI